LFYWEISFHPQIITFLPWFVFAILLSSANLIWRSLSAFSVVFITVIGFSFWSSYYSCEKVPYLKEFYSLYSLRPSELFDGIDGVLKAVIFAFDIFRIPQLLSFNSESRYGMIYISDLPSALIINFINLFIFLFCYAVFAATFYLVIRARKSYFSLNPIILHAILLLANLILWSATRGKFQYVVILPWFILLIVLIAAIKLKILSTYSQTNLLTNKIIVLLSITTLLLSTYFNVRYHIMGLQFTSDIASKNGDLGISRTSHMLSSNKGIFSKFSQRDLFAQHFGNNFSISENLESSVAGKTPCKPA
jgi:hypothetical protein